MWVAASDDVPGLATGADTLDALVDKLKVVIPELLEANGLLPAEDPGLCWTARLEPQGPDPPPRTLELVRHPRPA